MFATDPTLYGATFPHRDFAFTNPYFGFYKQGMIPWNMLGQQFPMTYGQQFPMTYGQQFPVNYGQQFPVNYGQQFPWLYGKGIGEFGSRFINQVPAFYGQNFYGLPHRSFFPFAY